MSITGMFKSKKWMYGLYTVACVLFFVWYLFPSEFFADYLEYRINSVNPSARVDITTVKPALPLGVKLSGITLTVSDDQTFRADSVNIRPGLVSLIRLKPEIKCAVDIFGGTVKGTVSIPEGDPNKASLQSIDVSGIKLELLSGLISLVAPGYSISGVLNAEGFYSPEGDAAGKLSVSVTDLVVTPENPIFSIDKLNFRTITAELDLNKKKLQVVKCDVDGLEADGFLSGTIFVRKPFPRSTLRLSGTVKPEQEFIDKLSETVPVEAFLGKNPGGGDGIGFRVSGSLTDPKLSKK